jgi:hypothetical protein
MNAKLSQVFKHISQIEPSLELKGLILRRLKRERSRLTSRKLAFVYSGLAASVAAFFYAFAIFGSAILRSDFWNLLSLIFSDAGVVVSHWNDFLLSLLENLPVLNIMAILIPVFAMLILLNLYSKYSKLNNQSRFKFVT